MKRYILVSIVITIITLLSTGCSQLAAINSYNSDVMIPTVNETPSEEVIPMTSRISTKPPITKRIITDLDGVVYLTDFPSYGDSLRVSWYWIKEKGYWVYRDDVKDFPLNVDIKSYPQGGEYGDLRPQSDMKYYLTLPDGTIYATRYEITPIATTGSIRISMYFQHDRGDERWYYHAGSIDLPKNIRIDQVKVSNKRKGE